MMNMYVAPQYTKHKSYFSLEKSFFSQTFCKKISVPLFNQVFCTGIETQKGHFQMEVGIFLFPFLLSLGNFESGGTKKVAKMVLKQKTSDFVL